MPWQAAQTVCVVFTFLCADTLLGAVSTKQSPQLSEVGRTLTVVLPVEPLTWQTEHTVVAVTFLCAEVAGAVPTAHVPQLSEVRRITIVPVAGIAGVAGVAGIARRVWQDEHAIMAALTPVWTEVLGALPTVHVPQLSLVASALPEKSAGMTSVAAKRMDLSVSFMMTPDLTVS